MYVTSLFTNAHNPQINAGLEKLLRRRMKLPQRHRLLHAYPLHAGMPLVKRQQSDITTRLKNFHRSNQGSDKGMLVFLNPHPFCNPSFRGCGFCTFPHEKYRASIARSVVDAVIA